MIRKFFIWRAQKKLSRSRYGMDRRSYRQCFGPGFFGANQGVDFYKKERAYLFAPKRRRRRLWVFVLIFLTIAATWFLMESLAFFELF